MLLVNKAASDKATLADADISEADFTRVYSNEAIDKHKKAEAQALCEAEEAHENHDHQQYDSVDEEQYSDERLKSEGNKLLKNEISKAKGKPKLPDYLQAPKLSQPEPLDPKQP